MQMKLSDPSQSFVLVYLHNMSNKEMEGKRKVLYLLIHLFIQQARV